MKKTSFRPYKTAPADAVSGCCFIWPYTICHALFLLALEGKSSENFKAASMYNFTTVQQALQLLFLAISLSNFRIHTV